MLGKISLESFREMNLSSIKYNEVAQTEPEETNKIGYSENNKETQSRTIRTLNDDELYISENEIKKAPKILEYLNKNDYVEIIDDSSYQLMGYFDDLKERKLRAIQSETSLNSEILDTYKLRDNIPFDSFDISTQNKIGIELMRSTNLIFEFRGSDYIKSSRMTYLLEHSFLHDDEDPNYKEEIRPDNGMLEYWYDAMIRSNDINYINLEQTDYADIPFINVPLILIEKQHLNNMVRFYLSIYQFQTNFKLEETEYLFDCDEQFLQNKEINNKRFFVNTFQRFLKTRRNKIPFADGFGNSLKDFLQTKASKITIKMITEEIYAFCVDFNTLYDENFKFQDIKISYQNNGQYMKIIIDLVFEIKKQTGIENFNIGLMGPSIDTL